LTFVRTWVNSAPGGDEAGKPVAGEGSAVVGDEHDLAYLAGRLVGDRARQRLAGQGLGLDDRQLDRGHGIVLVRGDGDYLPVPRLGFLVAQGSSPSGSGCSSVWEPASGQPGRDCWSRTSLSPWSST
jgi:hypothetical protein